MLTIHNPFLLLMIALTVANNNVLLFCCVLGAVIWCCGAEVQMASAGPDKQGLEILTQPGYGQLVVFTNSGT